MTVQISRPMWCLSSLFLSLMQGYKIETREKFKGDEILEN